MINEYTEYAIKKSKSMIDPALIGKNVALKSKRSDQLIRTELFTVKSINTRHGYYSLKSVNSGIRENAKHYHIAHIFKENDSITFESLLNKNEQYQQKYNDLLKFKNEFWQILNSEDV